MPMILPLSNYDSCSYCLRKRRNGISTPALPLYMIHHTQPIFGYLFYTPRRTTLNALYRLYRCAFSNAGNLNGFTWISRQQEVPIVVASLSITIGSTTYHVTWLVIIRKGQYDPDTTA
ncbi:hypothetical protein TNCV_679321 [Trichonephila clavipes]|nr:hypothetical protein TNCV_679321 [Trichonephila clavipes]